MNQRTARYLLALSVIGLCVGESAPTRAQAASSRFQRLAANTTAFASDGTRYVAWQAGKTAIVIYDSRTHSDRTIEDGCSLEGRPASLGRFLVQCAPDGKAPGLLDGRSGVQTPLPIGQYGPFWTSVGRHYVSGEASVYTRCPGSKRYEGCSVLFDIGSGRVLTFPESQVRDPDRPGAPPICTGLRHAIFHLAAHATEFSYQDGLLARWLLNADGIRLEGCGGHARILRSRSEPFDIELRGGLLTWDAIVIPESSGEEPEEAEETHGAVEDYRLSTGARHARSVPHAPMSFDGRHVRGVRGYSAHTDYAVFWIAAQAVHCDRGCTTTTSYVYDARLPHRRQSGQH